MRTWRRSDFQWKSKRAARVGGQLARPCGCRVGVEDEAVRAVALQQDHPHATAGRAASAVASAIASGSLGSLARASANHSSNRCEGVGGHALARLGLDAPRAATHLVSRVICYGMGATWLWTCINGSG